MTQILEFSGKVIRGEGRGRQIGTPTANLDNVNLPLDYGVYLVEVRLSGKSYKGLLHYGPKKTINEIVSTEVFIKDFNEDIYGQELLVKVIKRLRPIIKFKSIEELIARIEKDKSNLQ